MDCIFCKIATGEIPANKLYEDENVIAFYDQSPQAPVHFLVIPATHMESANSVTAENSYLIGKCFEVIAKLAAELCLSGGYRVITNCGPDAGQTVGHLHFHVLAGRHLGEKLLK